MGALALEEPCGCVNALEHAGVGAGPMAALFRATAKALEHARDTDEMGELPSNILAVALQAGVHECSDLPGSGCVLFVSCTPSLPSPGYCMIFA